MQRGSIRPRVGLERLAAVRLYVLLDGRASVEEFERMAQQLIGAAVDVIQLRDKRLADRELIDRARRLRRLTRETLTRMVINDRPDLAAGPGRRGSRGPGGAFREGRAIDRRS